MITSKDIDFILNCMKWNRYNYIQKIDMHIAQDPNCGGARLSKQQNLDQMQEAEKKLYGLREWLSIPESINQINEEIKKMKLVLKHFEEDKQGFLKIKKLQKIKINKDGKIRFFKEDEKEKELEAQNETRTD